jgi:predicted dehydrogenase
MCNFECIHGDDHHPSRNVKLRYGIVGTGRASTMHTQLLLGEDQIIAAVSSEDQTSMENFFENLSAQNLQQQQQHQNPHVANVRALTKGRFLSRDQVKTFNSADAMAKAHKDGLIKLDAVVIASHTSRHASDAEPFVRLGVKVYLEKPIACDLSDTFDFIKNVVPPSNNESSAAVQVGLQRRFDEALTYARQLVFVENRIGPIREVRVVLRERATSNPCTYQSSGIIKDLGISGVDEFIFLTGGVEMPSKIWALKFEARESGKAPPNVASPASSSSSSDGANTAFITFTTTSGIIGRIDLSRTHSSRGYVNTTEIMGTKGTVTIGRHAGYPGPVEVEMWTPEGIKCNENSRTFEMAKDLTFGEENAQSIITAVKGSSQPQQQRRGCGPIADFLPRFRDAFLYAHRSFREDVVDKKAFKVTPMDALDAQVVVEAATISAEKGCVPIEVKKSNNLDEYHNNCRKAGLC